jgi:hypothetical protein
MPLEGPEASDDIRERPYRSELSISHVCSHVTPRVAFVQARGRPVRVE